MDAIGRRNNSWSLDSNGPHSRTILHEPLSSSRFTAAIMASSLASNRTFHRRCFHSSRRCLTSSLDGKVTLVIGAQRLENITRIALHAFPWISTSTAVKSKEYWKLRRSLLCTCVFHDQSPRTKSCRAISVIRT